MDKLQNYIKILNFNLTLVLHGRRCQKDLKEHSNNYHNIQLTKYNDENKHKISHDYRPCL